MRERIFERGNFSTVMLPELQTMSKHTVGSAKQRGYLKIRITSRKKTERPSKKETTSKEGHLNYRTLLNTEAT
jgi:hypothetical protein